MNNLNNIEFNSSSIDRYNELLQYNIKEHDFNFKNLNKNINEKKIHTTSIGSSLTTNEEGVINMKQVYANIFTPGVKTYIVNPNSVEKVIDLDNDIGVQVNDVSKNLYSFVVDGLNYIKTDNSLKLKEELDKAILSYNYYSLVEKNPDEIKNKGEVEKINKQIATLENTIDKQNNSLAKLRGDFNKHRNAYDKSRDKIVDFANNLTNTEHKEKLQDVLNNRIAITALREEFHKNKSTLSKEDKEIINKEVINLNNINKTIIRELNNDLKKNKEYNPKNDILKIYNEFENSTKKLEYNSNNSGSTIYKIDKAEADLAKQFEKLSNLNIKKYEVATLTNDSDFLKAKFLNEDGKINREELKKSGAYESFHKLARLNEGGSESGNWNMAHRLNDGAGMNFGAYSMTENSGNLKKLLVEFSNTFPNTSDGKMAKHYADRIKEVGKSGFWLDSDPKASARDGKFKSFLMKIGNDPKFIEVQKSFFEKNFIEPALNHIDQLNNIKKPNGELLYKEQIYNPEVIRVLVDATLTGWRNGLKGALDHTIKVGGSVNNFNDAIHGMVSRYFAVGEAQRKQGRDNYSGITEEELKGKVYLSYNEENKGKGHMRRIESILESKGEINESILAQAKQAKDPEILDILTSKDKLNNKNMEFNSYLQNIKSLEANRVNNEIDRLFNENSLAMNY